MNHDRSRRAFTVVELMVVMGIIGVLATLLFSIIGEVRSMAKTANCANNERMIFVAMTSFAADHDGSLPVPAQVGESPSGNGPNVAWALDDRGVVDYKVGTLWPYLSTDTAGRAAVCWCPADNTEIDYNGGIATSGRNFSYSFNSNIGHPSGQVSMKLAAVAQPASRIFIYEEQAPNDQWSLGGTNPDDLPSGRHGTFKGDLQGNSTVGSAAWLVAGRGNYCFFDGHIGLFSPQTIMTDASHNPSMYYPLAD